MKSLVTGSNKQLENELKPLLEEAFQSMNLFTDIEDLDLTDAKRVEVFFLNNEISHVVNCAT